EIQSIFPEKITTTFVARGSAVSIITREILDARVNIPPIKLEGGVEIPLGLTRFSLTNFALNIGKELSLSLDFGLGLPASLNKNFGTNEKDEPFLNIFNTFDPVNPEETTIRLRLAVGTKGVKLVLATSPFAFITFKEKDGKVWCYADFGECGAVRFQVPEFSLDLKTRSFVFNGGFEVVRDLALPLHLVKMLLKGMKAEGVADILPDKVPLQEISILNKQDKLEIDKIIKLVEDILHIDIPAEFEAVLEIMAEGVNRLPDDLRKYLKITLPKSFNFDISVTPENQGLSIKAGVKKGDPPIRMLIPSLGAFYLPELIGLEFYSFSLGEIFATNFLLLELNLRIDHFDLLTLSAALALGTDHGLPLPSSNEIQRHYIIEDLFMLIITAIKVYGIPIPIPIPLFYKELGFEYYGFEGVKAQGHIGFPKPELNIAGLVKAVKDFVLFVIKPEARMDPKALGKMDLKFHIGANYIQLPKYLGRKSIGTKKGIPL
ncbi:MAG: hypothetical protein GTO45_02930, partial [Candidatus Aminicenantes bacterium]|nr:hypothetical protein [Candidatus Aminicenantes bacterium]NIM77680.1 hypothetical protein [Candidatus Aminicenantes bacterium]NIN16993.1 hypothetical protein [Candidatus Aminicenantes bacterium]NIN40886.1 hypothetical protein [Candidatus Aminicenantes bacterium]NIN83691.1 hypothetical protein [Candidatus Aminicenantes bacterium]